MILYFDLADASKRRINAYKALGSINTNLIVSAPYRAFWLLLDGSDVLIII